MADKEFNTRIKHKRDTDTNWTTNNPVLLDGEIIIVDTIAGTARTKIGDGMQTYTQLPFDCDFAETDLSNVSNTDFLTKAKSVNIVTSPFVIEITFAPSLSGQPFVITGGGFTYSGVVPIDLVTSVNVGIPDTTYTVTCGGYYSFAKTTNLFGICTTKIGFVSPILAENSWADIEVISSLGIIPAGWKIGDEKDVVLTTGEQVTFQIYGFNHDDLATGSGKAGITFGMKNLLSAQRQTHIATSNLGGFSNGEMRRWLNRNIILMLPADLQAAIKPVIKRTSAGNQSSSINTDSVSIFLFSEVECDGAFSNSYEGEGMQYPVFNTYARRVKSLSNGEGIIVNWWMRSPSKSTGNYVILSTSGFPLTASATSQHGVCFGFCI